MKLHEYNDQSLMVACFLPKCFRDQVATIIYEIDPMLTELDNLHVTIAYLGKLGDNISEDQLAKVRLMMEHLACPSDLVATIGGIGYFKPSTSSEDKYVQYLSVSCPDLELLRADLILALRDEKIDIPNNFGYTPHMTLAYTGADKLGLLSPAEGPLRDGPEIKWRVKGLTLAQGPQRQYYKFGAVKELTTTAAIATRPMPMRKDPINQSLDDLISESLSRKVGNGKSR